MSSLCRIVYEGPDEPDPAFEGFFHGTKRYTPRNRTGRRWKHHRIFFLLSTLEATSDFLARILEPQLDAYHAALEDDPLAELDDFLAFSALPDETQRALNKRGDWVRKCYRDGDKLDQWDAARKKQANAERRRVREEEKAKAEDARAFLSAAAGAPE
ncbi:hypothetical protein Rhopal_000688-T1 [Rhodotorula paludigena]|uniref:Uncharacterized protein n=1 Tax=Rhodotorula paludigena TaxID=86838 RepID=A0AAV5GCC6_9BASI|nr:hypothetical protein Rhopal_000688-T1 [Rhodotorula paludigena]